MFSWERDTVKKSEIERVERERDASRERERRRGKSAFSTAKVFKDYSF
jgi:hypothetical protein